MSLGRLESENPAGNTNTIRRITGRMRFVILSFIVVHDDVEVPVFRDVHLTVVVVFGRGPGQCLIPLGVV